MLLCGVCVLWLHSQRGDRTSVHTPSIRLTVPSAIALPPQLPPCQQSRVTQEPNPSRSCQPAAAYCQGEFCRVVRRFAYGKGALEVPQLVTIGFAKRAFSSSNSSYYSISTKVTGRLTVLQANRPLLPIKSDRLSMRLVIAVHAYYPNSYGKHQLSAPFSRRRCYLLGTTQRRLPMSQTVQAPRLETLQRGSGRLHR